MSSKSKKERERRASRLRGWITFRYLFPVLAAVLSVIGLFIPCVRYTTVQEGVGDLMSAAEVYDTFWYEVRQELFAGSAVSSASNTAFAETVFAVLIVNTVLFVIGFAAAVWSAVGAFLYFRDPEGRGMARAIWLTLFPNRVVTCLWEALTLPLLFITRILPWCYRGILGVEVHVTLSFAEPWMVGLALFALVILFSVLSAPTEVALGMNPFRARRRSETVRREEPTEPVNTEPRFESEAERRYYEMSQRAKEEQAERIRQLLSRDDGASEDDSSTES